MKNSRTIFVAAFMLTAMALTAQIRDMTWGETQDAVVAKEGADYKIRDALYVFYTRPMGGKDRTLVYSFDADERLVTISWLIDPDEFNDYCKVLTGKYGEHNSVDVGTMSWLLDSTLVSLYTDYKTKAYITYANVDYVNKLKEEHLKGKEKGL
jgi:hypothetical protein